MKQQYLHCGRYFLPVDINHRPLVMGILNVTPNSFFDGGKNLLVKYAVAHAQKMISSGVDIIDIGGASSQPGVAPSSLKDELKRVIPVLRALHDCGKPISIDTYKPQVMHEALLNHVDMINDINAFRAPGAIKVIQNSRAGLCIMHMQNTPKNMQDMPLYDNVVKEVREFLLARVKILEQVGIQRTQLCIDPGFGFGKTVEHNFILLRDMHLLIRDCGIPMLVGMSRKSMIGQIVGKSVNQRLAGSLAAALIAAEKGARIVRVHDVAETVDALNVWHYSRTIEFDKAFDKGIE